MIPRWWTQSAAQAREFNFIGPKDFRPPSQRNPGPSNYNRRGAGAPPPSVQTEYSVGGQTRSAQVLGPGYTPPGRSPVPQIKRAPSRKIVRPPTQSEWADSYKAARAANLLRRMLTRANPYMNALDIGFQLLDAWSAYGPQSEETPGQFVPGGFTTFVECTDPGPYSDAVYSRTARSVTTNPCIANQAISSPSPMAQDIINQGLLQRRLGLWGRQLNNPARYRHLATYMHPAGVDPSSLEPPHYVPAQAGRRTVQRSPTAIVPSPAVTSNYDRPPRDTHRPAPIIGTLKPLNPTRPSEVPANTVEVSPGGIHVPPQKPHVLAPPQPGGKEIKFNVRKGSPFYNALSNVYNGVTEAGDFMEVLANSLEGNPCKGLKLWERTTCIGENFHKFDLDAFMEGLIYNHIEDQLMGSFLSWGSKSPYGVQTPTTAPARRPHYARRPYVYRGNPNG